MMDVSQAIDEAQRLVRRINDFADQAERYASYQFLVPMSRDDAIEFIDAIETLTGEAQCLVSSP